MQSYNLRSILKPVLITAGAAFLFVTAGCGRQSVTTPPTAPSGAKATVSTGSAAGSTTTDQAKQADKDLERMKAVEEKIPHIEASQEELGTTWVENGIVRMKAKADFAHYDGLHRMGSLKNFSAVLYENGKPSATMTAPSVICDVVKKTVTAEGGVVVKSLDGENVIKSKWMKWFSREQRVVGGGNVDAIMGVWHSVGPGFVADTALKGVTVRPLVKGQDF